MARRSAGDGELVANLDDPDGPPRGPEVDDHAAAPGAHAGQHELAHADQPEHIRLADSE